MIKQFLLPVVLFAMINHPYYPVVAQTSSADNVFALSLEELMEIEVDVASLFLEEERVVGSSVSKITPDEWKKMGARRMHEALNNELSVFSYETMSGGSPAIAIRGFTQQSSMRGISTTIDGVPVNTLSYGTSFYQMPNWELGTLNRIELVKGPGSAIYGSDAFHGVLSLKTFESDEDYCAIEGAGAYPLYGNANVKLSRGFSDNRIRLDMAVSKSSQSALDLGYSFYDDAGTSVRGDRKNQYDSASSVLKLSAKPKDNLSVKIGVYADYWEGDDFSGSGIHAGSKDVSDVKDNLYMVRGLINYTLGNDISIEAGSSYWEATTANDFVLFENFIDSGSDLWVASEWTDTRSEMNLTVKQPDNGLNLQWVLACSHTDFETKDTFFETKDTLNKNLLGGDEPSSGASGYEGFDRSINSVLGQLKWGAVRDKLYFLVGSRLNHYDDLGDQYTPRGGIIVLPTKRSTVKALYGRGFRAPTAGEQAGVSSIKGNPDLAPEDIDVYELIYLYHAPSWKASLNGFYSVWKNGIAVKPYRDFEDPRIVEIYANVAESVSYGSEISMSYFKKAFSVDLGLSYVLSEALDVKDPNDPATTIDQRYAAFPEYSLLMAVSYFLKPYDLIMYLNNRVYWGMEEMPFDVSTTGNPDELSAYWRTDFSINKIISERTEINVAVQNLLNRENYTPSLWGSRGGLVEPGISGLLRVSYTF